MQMYFIACILLHALLSGALRLEQVSLINKVEQSE